MFSFFEPAPPTVLEAAIGGGSAGTKVFFITNRNELKNGDTLAGFGTDPHQRGSHWLRVGNATVDITENEATACQYADDEDINIIDLVVHPEVIQDSPEHHHLGSNRLFADLQRSLRDEQKDLILYVHGYDTTFKEALWSAAQIRLRYNRVLENLLDDEASAPFLARCPRGFETLAISWPSDGQRLDHWGDQHAALQSSRALGRALLKARDFVERSFRTALADVFDRSMSRAEILRAVSLRKIACPGQIHIIVEGNGGLVFRMGFQDFLTDPSITGDLPKLFGQIFMAGADEDPDAFQDELKLRRLPEVASRVTCYYNPNDLFTGISRFSKHPPKRIGNSGPARLVDLAHLDIVDCARVIDPATDGFGQFYARTNDIVARDMVLSMCGASGENRPNRQRTHPAAPIHLIR